MIRALPGDRVFAVQMNDGPRRPQLDDYKQDCMVNRVPPGEGEFDCVGFVRLLAEIGVRCTDLAGGVLGRAVGGAGRGRRAAGGRRHAGRARRGRRLTTSGQGSGVDGHRRTGHERGHVAAAEEHDPGHVVGDAHPAERVGRRAGVDVDAGALSGAIWSRTPGVSMIVGATPRTRMPSGPSSRASALVSPTTACLDAT